jgi:hypothetical protein
MIPTHCEQSLDDQQGLLDKVRILVVSAARDSVMNVLTARRQYVQIEILLLPCRFLEINSYVRKLFADLLPHRARGTV